jgi:hypothetical protein
MYKDPEELQSDTTKSRFMPEELYGLIDALQNLHIHISSILARTRINAARPPSGPRDSLNIADPLKEYIVRATVKPRGSGQESMRQHVESLRSHRDVPIGSVEHAEPPSPWDHEENALSQYLVKKAADHDYHPDMGEKMRANTIEHIKKAMRLAKQGDEEGAKINADLADSAMKTAIEYMSEDEYVIFRQEVIKRLDALQGME